MNSKIDETKFDERFIPCNLILTTDNESKLFIGNLLFAMNYDSSDSELLEECGGENLKKYKIESILSITHENPSILGEYEKNNIVWKRYEFSDDEKENLLLIFAEAHEFIDNQLKKGNVLVHCDMGKSRSGCIVVSYVMWRLKMRLIDALKYCQERRKMIFPNRGFMNQLEEYEKELFKNDD